MIKNILDKDDLECVPMQIDLVILGKKHERSDEKGGDDDEEDEDDSDDEDDENFFATINASTKMGASAPLCNPLPEETMAEFLKKRKIDVEEDKISYLDQARSIRTVQEKIISKIGIFIFSMIFRWKLCII